MDPLRPPLIRRLTPAQWVAVDCVAAALLVALSTYFAQGPLGTRGPSNADAAVVVAATVAAGMRRRSTRTALALVVLVAVLSMGITTFPAPWVAVAFVIYMVPVRLDRTEALGLLAGTIVVAGVVLADPYGGPGPNRLTMIAGMALLITTAWTIGYAVRQQRMYAAGVRERERLERHAEGRRAVSEERLRIARELHDVVAHTMSVIAVQAGVANHVAVERPDEARRALSSIEETSRGALREMRALLGVLRDDGNEDPAPAPGLTDLGALVTRAAAAGVRVDLQVTGSRPAGLSAGLDLAAYRVVQEAVTNVIKHAGTDRCQVIVAYAADAFTVEVVDDGPGPAAPGAGHGIAGMRERVGMYGGEFQAGPRSGAGFRVTARFPLTFPAAP
ncbi:signal transduction histidine kinase [Asanoa ferruginea]|uniref:histidine kinase n=1 Tax=Asanoa ferruginea TaxID=53367 RepID=A0A3D9ZWA2_9ACTN|nr:sensor histidine kinase [Asanoa ferruginea]REG00823.1 signal transduction histidine kinase [Asanoa ferruginea]GIF47302.1 two-component sensor histidine kinase [Asanoa ferruginea]